MNWDDESTQAPYRAVNRIQYSGDIAVLDLDEYESIEKSLLSIK
jgi:hypothetical protein